MATLLKKLENGYEFMEGGARSDVIEWNEDGTIKSMETGRPKIGCSMRVGSIMARSYSNRDWWTTTEVLEILEESEEEVKFRTKNSVYIWRK